MTNENRTNQVHAASGNDLLSSLYGLNVAEILTRQASIEGLLNHREIEVRRAAAEALGIAGVGATALRERLTLEKNDLVLAEILDSLGALQDADSLPDIYRLASDHPSQLVRTFAVLALQEIEGADDLKKFLQTRLRLERSRRVQVAIAYVLVDRGDRNALEPLMLGLNSRDPIVRLRVASLIRQVPPRNFTKELRRGLQERLDREDVEGRASLEQALEALSAVEDSP